MAQDEREYMIERARKRLNAEYAAMEKKRIIRPNKQGKEASTMLIAIFWIALALALWAAFEWAGVKRA